MPRRDLEIRSIPQLLRVLERYDEAMMFRGQAVNWPLLPSLGRLKCHDLVHENWQVLQMDMMERFAKYARPKIIPLPDSEEDWLVHAQHYGVPTRLLDWSTNPLKALFWAVEDHAHVHHDGELWMFEPYTWMDDPLAPTHLCNKQLVTFFPKHLNDRVVAQEACFVSFPLLSTTKPMQPMNNRRSYRGKIGFLEVIKIPAAAKPGLLRELSVLGVTHRSLYPDLFGIAQHIKAEILGI